MKRCLAVSPLTAAALASKRGMSVNGLIKHQGHIPMSQPLGQGKVVPLTFDYLRPHYRVPPYYQLFGLHFIWFQTSMWPNLVLCFTVIWAIHGGFTGHLPPDPHVLWG